jgi:5-methyltetrahydrofolate--homocysteine methyltransferase
MARASLKERIRQDLFLLDGAMGTQLMAHGIEAGRCYDYQNIESPDIVLGIHRAYLRAGSDAVLTNTFGANKYALSRHGFDENVEEINTAGAEIARRAAGEKKYVLGDIGPSGDFLEPLGNLSSEGLRDAFARQAKALLEGAVDGFIIESMMALEEVTIAIEAARSVGDDLPVFASMAFGRAGDDFKTMMGVDVETAVSKILSLGVDAVGFNCGSMSLEDYVELAGRYAAAVKTSGHAVVIYAEPNAGKPELVEGKAVYRVSPEDFAAAAERIHSAGVNIIGGCCGTGPAHIKAISKKLRVVER